jgi:hypothetical protein
LVQVGSYTYTDEKMAFEATLLEYSEDYQKTVLDYEVQFR